MEGWFEGPGKDRPCDISDLRERMDEGKQRKRGREKSNWREERVNREKVKFFDLMWKLGSNAAQFKKRRSYMNLSIDPGGEDTVDSRELTARKMKKTMSRQY
jgi:hypothetical protein